MDKSIGADAPWRLQGQHASSSVPTGLRDDFEAIATVEAGYRVDGLSVAERDDLARRFDELSAEIRVARNDLDRD